MVFELGTASIPSLLCLVLQLGRQPSSISLLSQFHGMEELFRVDLAVSGHQQIIYHSSVTQKA